MQYLYLIGCILDWISFAAGDNANAISIHNVLDRLYIILDWISFAAGANANAISIYLIGYSYIY